MNNFMNPALLPFIKICLKEAWSETRSFFPALKQREPAKFTLTGKKFVALADEGGGETLPKIFILGPEILAEEEKLELSTLNYFAKNYLGAAAQYVTDGQLLKGSVKRGLAKVCIVFTRKLSDQACIWIKQEVEEYGAGLIVLGGDSSLLNQNGNLRKSFGLPLPLIFNGYAQARGPLKVVKEDSPLFSIYHKNSIYLKFGGRKIAQVNPTGGSVVAVYRDDNVFGWQGELGQGKIFYFNADMISPFLAEVCRHNYASNSPAAICNFICLLKTFYSVTVKQVESRDIVADDRAVALFTVDTEAQGRYFDNSLAQCTNCLGSILPTQDTMLSAALDRTIKRVRPYGIPLTFMLTTAELDGAENDLWGAPLAEKEKGLNALTQARQNGNEFGYHAYHHEAWLKKGYKFLLPMKPWSKLKYFRDTGLGWPAIREYIKFIYQHSQQINKSFTLSGTSDVTMHRQADILTDVAEWYNSLIAVLAGTKVKLTRYPGLARSPEVIAALNLAGFVLDSSDIYGLDEFLVPLPYRLLQLNGETITETNIWEIPALFIDPYLRSSNFAYNQKFLEFIQQIIAIKESYLVLLTHDKVVGAESSHLHVYMGNPFVSLGLPLREENLTVLLDSLRNKVKFISGTAMADLVAGKTSEKNR